MFNGFYTEKEKAGEVISSRGDRMKSLVEEWWADSEVEFPNRSVGKEPCAFFARNIPTFRYEDAVFVQMAESADLSPCWVGYSDDKMVTASPLKVSLLNPTFAVRMGKKGGVVLEKFNIASCKRNQGRKLSEVVCEDDSVSLCDFHLEQLLSLYPEAKVWDFSKIAFGLGGKAESYYVHFLSLTLAHGVLFEDYHNGESGRVLNGFTVNVFEPAFRRVEKIFGCSPTIVPMPWVNELKYYPSVDFVNSERNKIPWREHPYASMDCFGV